MSLVPVNSEQQAEGVGMYPDSIKSKARFADRQAESVEEMRR